MALLDDMNGFSRFTKSIAGLVLCSAQQRLQLPSLWEAMLTWNCALKDKLFLRRLEVGCVWCQSIILKPETVRTRLWSRSSDLNKIDTTKIKLTDCWIMDQEDSVNGAELLKKCRDLSGMSKHSALLTVMQHSSDCTWNSLCLPSVSLSIQLETVSYLFLSLVTRVVLMRSGPTKA